MRQLLGAIHQKLLYFITVMSWRCDTSAYRKSIRKKEKDFLLSKGKYLILIPHADDEWVGCSQIILQNDFDVVLLNMDMEGGDSTELHEARRKELDKIASTYHRSLKIVGSNKVLSLEELLMNLRPDYICLPYFFDWHPEHIEVMIILRDVLKKVLLNSKILMYQVSLAIPPSECNGWSAMTRRAWHNKWHTFEDVYKSQTVIPYQRFAFNERINGAIADSYAAEVYSVMSCKDWQQQIETFLLDEIEKRAIMQVLNRIGKTRELLEKFLKKRK